MSFTPLEQSIIKTLAFFDISKHPLTKEELYRFLWQPPVIGYQEFLEKLENTNCLEKKFSYYFLPGQEKNIESRRENLLFSEQKLNLAAKAAKKIRSVPYLRAIFVCNTVGMEQATAESDIDFFIITSSKRIWLVRFFTNLILRLFGLRAYGQRVSNRVCLSFYVDNDHLNLASLRQREDDVYLAYWLNQLLPIYDPENLHDKILTANQWAKKYLPNVNDRDILCKDAKFCVSTTHRLRVTSSKLGSIWKKMWEKMWGIAYGNLLETQAKNFQLAKMQPAFKERASKDDKAVILADGILKFHLNDRRTWYYQEWKSKI